MNKMILKVALITFLVALFSTQSSFALQLALPAVFSDHMVIQRDQPVPIWGKSDPKSTITVEFAGRKKTADADGQGKWKVILDPIALSSESRELNVSAVHGSETANKKFTDVLVGEVWLCAGQSNMGFRMKRTDAGREDAAKADYPQIRFYHTPAVASEAPVEYQIPSTKNPSYNPAARWEICTPNSIKPFSAVAFYFGRKLHEDLHVPIGLILSSVAGSSIEAWTPPHGFKKIKALDGIYQITQNLPKLSGDVMTDRSVPSVLYNGLIAGHIPYAIRGVIWYQGESNVGDGMQYVDKAKAMVNEWRELWGYEFPFYLVQVAPYQGGEDDDQLPQLWEAQSEITRIIPKTGMAVISDAATLDDRHPPNKKIPGTRLALLAEAHTYGMDVVSTGPVFETLEKEGNSLKVNFTSAKGLTTRDGKEPDWFEVAGKDGVFKPAKATIQAGSVLLSSPEVAIPVAMRFAWNKIAVPNLVNGAGLPASPFRTGEIPK